MRKTIPRVFPRSEPNRELARAVMERSLGDMEAALDAGASPETRVDGASLTILGWTAKQGFWEGAELLLRRGASWTKGFYQKDDETLASMLRMDFARTVALWKSRLGKKDKPLDEWVLVLERALYEGDGELAEQLGWPKGANDAQKKRLVQHAMGTIGSFQWALRQYEDDCGRMATAKHAEWLWESLYSPHASGNREDAKIIDWMIGKRPELVPVTRCVIAGLAGSKGRMHAWWMMVGRRVAQEDNYSSHWCAWMNEAIIHGNHKLVGFLCDKRPGDDVTLRRGAQATKDGNWHQANLSHFVRKPKNRLTIAKTLEEHGLSVQGLRLLHMMAENAKDRNEEVRQHWWALQEWLQERGLDWTNPEGMGKTPLDALRVVAPDMSARVEQQTLDRTLGAVGGRNRVRM